MSSKVLVADDEAHILHVVSMKLRNAGLTVVTAVDGEEALDVCRAEQPDLVITDYQMPYMTGMELCMAMREEGIQIPAVLLTARGFDIEPDEMLRAGIAAVLAKPFSPREVLAKVHQLLEPATEASEATN